MPARQPMARSIRLPTLSAPKGTAVMVPARVPVSARSSKVHSLAAAFKFPPDDGRGRKAIQRAHPLASVPLLAHFLDESLARARHGVDERRNELDIAWQGTV